MGLEGTFEAAGCKQLGQASQQNFPVVVLNVGAMSSVKYASGIISCNDQSMKAVCEVSYEFLYLASKVDVFHKR